MPNVASMKCSNVCAHGMTRTMSWQLEQKQDWKRCAACGMNSVCACVIQLLVLQVLVEFCLQPLYPENSKRYQRDSRSITAPLLGFKLTVASATAMGKD